MREREAQDDKESVKQRGTALDPTNIMNPFFSFLVSSLAFAYIEINEIMFGEQQELILHLQQNETTHRFSKES